MLKILFVYAVIISTCSCGQKKFNNFKQNEVGNTDDFFPVTQYLRGQIKELSTLPLTPLKITTINGKADSAWIKREDIGLFVQPFITPEIDSVFCHTYFSEKSFLDQTINAFTFSYDPAKPLPDTAEIRRWDVYVDPQSNKVKRIYLVKQVTPMQTMQLTWKSGYSCKITTITDKGNAGQHVKEEELIWNFSN